jgi:hypothetical protein
MQQIQMIIPNPEVIAKVSECRTNCKNPENEDFVFRAGGPIGNRPAREGGITAKI